MVRRIRHQITKSKLRVPLVWLRHRGIKERDVFVASYPRSGSTWLRFLLFEALANAEAGFDNVNRVIPDVGEHASAPSMLPSQGRIIKTHEAYRSEYERAIYVVRDPRDVALSEFAYEGALGRVSGDFDRYLTDFLRGTATAYGSWLHHAESWIDSPLAARGNLMVVRYKDLRKDTVTYLERIVKFLGVSLDRQRIEEAIRNNDFQRMRAKEDQTPQLGKPTDDQKRFVRKGAVGGWRNQLTPEQLERIEENTAKMLTRLGYEFASPAYASMPNSVSAD
jgi:Sulfotransferase domain